MIFILSFGWFPHLEESATGAGDSINIDAPTGGCKPDPGAGSEPVLSMRGVMNCNETVISDRVAATAKYDSNPNPGNPLYTIYCTYFLLTHKIGLLYNAATPYRQVAEVAAWTPVAEDPAGAPTPGLPVPQNR